MSASRALLLFIIGVNPIAINKKATHDQLISETEAMNRLNPFLGSWTNDIVEVRPEGGFYTIKHSRRVKRINNTVLIEILYNDYNEIVVLDFDLKTRNYRSYFNNEEITSSDEKVLKIAHLSDRGALTWSTPYKYGGLKCQYILKTVDIANGFWNEKAELYDGRDSRKASVYSVRLKRVKS